VNTAAKTKLKR